MGNGVSSESEDEGGPAVETRGKVVKATGDVQEKFEFNKLANLFQDIGEVTDPQCHSLTSGEELNLISCYDSLVAWLTSRKQSGEPQITDVQLVDFLGGQQISEEFARRLFNAVDTDALGAVRVSDLLDFVKKGNWANYADLNAVVDRLDRTTLMPSAVDIFGDFDRSEVECHADQIFKYLRQQIPVAAEFIEFPYNLHDNLVDLRLRLLKKWYQTAKTFEAMNSEQQNAKGPSEGKMFLKPPELCYSELLVSSNNSDVGLLTDLNPTTYWQSDGQARSHFIRAKIKKGVIITAVHIGVNSTDSSYMPKTIGVSVGKTSSSATSELYRVAIPSSTNGEIQLLKHPLDQYYAFLQLNILACYSDGCDCRVRSLRFEGYRFSQSKAAKTPDLLVDRGFSWYLDILTSTVEACSSVAPSLRHAVMRHTLTALKDLEPLALCRSKINSVVSPRMLEKMQKFIENVGFGATDSPLEWKITALETFIRLAVCTGSVATTLKVALFALSNFNKEEADMITSDLMKFIHDSRRKVLVSLFEEHCKEDGDHAGLKLNDSNCVRNLLHDLVNLFVLICSDDDHVDYSGITVKLIIDSCDKVFSETDDDKINQLSITLLQSHFLDLVGIVISKGKVLADSEWGDKLFRMLVKLLKQGGSAVLSASVFKTLMSSAEICIPGEHTRREKLKEMLSSGSDPLLFGPVGESDPESLQFFSLCRYWTAQPLCHLFNDEEMWLEYLQRTFKLVTQRMLSRINKGPLNCPLEDARDEVFFAMVNSHLFSAVSRLEKSGSDAKLVCLMQIAVENLVFVLKSLGSLPNEQLNNLTTTDVTLGGLLTPLLTFGLGLFDRLKKGVPKYIWLPLIRGLVENRNCMKLLSNVTFDELMAKAMDAEPLEWFMTVTVQSDHPYSRHSFESKLLEAYGGRKFEVTFDDESELADGSSLEIITTTGSTRKFKGKMGNDGWPKTVTFYSCDRLIFRLISTEPNVSWGYKCSVSATPEKGAVKQFSWQSDLVLTLIKVLGKLIGSCVTESQSHFPHGHSQKDKRHHLVQTIFKNGKMKKISDELANLFNVGDDLLSEDKIHMVESAVADCELKTKVSAAMLNDDLAKRCFYGIFGAVYWYLDPVSLSSDPTNKSEPSEALLQMYVDCVGAMKKILRKRQDLVKSDEIATNDEPSVEDQPGQKYLEGCLDRAKILFKFQSTESPPADVTQTNFNSPITAAKKRFSRSISGRRRTVSIEENFQQHPYSPSVSAQIRPLLNFIVDDVVTAGEVEIWFREEQDSRDAAESGWKAIEEYLVATNFLEANVRSEYVGVLFLRELLQGTSVAIPRDNTNVLKVITMMAEKLTQTPSENLNEREALLFRQHREFLRVALLRIVATMTTGPVDQLLPIVLKYLVSSTVGEEVVADHQSLWTCSDKRLAIKHYTDAFAMLLCTAMMSKLAVETQKGSVEPHLLTNAIHLVTEQLALNTSLVRDYEEIRVEQRRLGLVAIAARSLKGSALELIVFTCVKFLKTGLLCGSRNDFLVGTILGKSLQRCSPQLADSICNQTSVTPVEGIAAGHLSLQFLFTFGCESLGQKDPQWPSLIVQIIQQLGRNDVWRLAVTEYLNEKVKTVLRIVLQSATTAVDDVHSAVFTLMCLCGFPNAPCPGKRVEFLDCDEWKKGVLVKLIAETGSATVVDVRKRVERSCKAKEYRCVSETPILTGTVEWPLLLEVLEKLSSGFAAKEPHCSNLPELLALYRDVLVFKSMKLFAAETLSTNKESLEDLYNPETLASLVKVAGRRTSFHVGCQLSQLEVLSLGILSLKAGADGTHLGDGLNELIADHEESPASVSDGGTITDPTVGPPGDEVVVNTAADDVDTDSEVDRVGPVVLVDPYWDMDIGGGHATNTLQAAIGAAAMWLNYLFGEEEKPESRRSQKQRNSLLGIRDPGLRIPSLSVFCHTLPSGGEIVRRLEQQFNEETSTGCSRCLYGLFEDHSDDCKQLDFTEEAAEHDEDLSSYAYCHKDGPTTAVKPTGTSAGFSCAVLQSHLILIARELLSIMLSHWPLDMSLWPEKFDLSGWDSFAALLDLIRTTNADGFKATLARVFEVGLKQTYLSDPSEFLQNMTTVGGEFILESSFHRREKLEFAKTGGTAEPVHVHLPSATFCAITIEGFSGGKLVLATSEDLIAHRMELTGKKTKEKVEGIVIEGKDIWLQYTSPNTSRAGVVTVTVESHVVGRLNVGLELLSLSLRTLEMGDVNLVNSIRLDDLVFQLVTAATYSVGDRQLTVIGLLVKVITFLLDFTGDIAKKPNLQHFVALWCILDATEKFAGQSEQHTTVKPSLSRALTELLFLVENLSIKWNQQNELAAELVPTAPVFKCFAQGIGTIAFIAAAIEYDCKAATLWSSFVEDGKVPIPDFPLVIRRTMGTFAQQESLPNLPVPPLKQTLQKYLDSVRPVVSERQFLQTKAIVEEFESSPVTKQLNEQLVERSKTTRNWLEEWWEHLVYLAPRYPIFPLINFGGCNIRSDVWPPINGSAPERAGLQIHFTLQFWKLLRQEALPVQKTRGNVLCMNQFHRLFNTCRIPGSDVDEFKLHFKTESEGSCPSHMVVLCNGKLFRLECFDDNGEPFTPPQIASAIRAVWIEANISPGPYVNTLTVSERSHWYEMREHLKQLSPENGSSLEQLESAIFVLSLTEENIFRPTDLHRFSITGHPKYQWADKSVVWHVHRNGLGSTTSDHGPFDAITTVAMSHFVDLELQKINFTWPSKSDDGVVPHFKELKFTVDDKIKKGINTAIETWSAYDRDLEVEYWEFSAFGNEYLKPLKIYGDTVVQLAMQLAYLRLHSRPAPTYETATTRKFYHGRTETVRSCTVEAVEWAKLMIDPKANDRQRGEKLLRAIKKHNQLMDEAQNNHGCDRHLMGLQVLAKLNGMADPPIFSDPSWTKSGGGGNFVLSTSFVGYTNVAGGVAPMMTDGYGCFYRINDNLISFFTSRWKSSGETNLLLWRDSVTWSLRQIKLLIDNTTNPSKM